MFPGFPHEALTFFRGLERNNNREWFQPRKESFENLVKAPMIALCEALNAEFSRFAPAYINDPKKAVYRIYRDLRFSADKSPYKTHLAAVFPRRGGEKLTGSGGHGASASGFYFAVSAKGVGVAGGVYEASPEQMWSIRTWLTGNHERFRNAARRPEKLMGKLQGHTLQRIPKGFDAAHPAADLIKLKQWLYFTTLEPKLATSPKLLAELVRRFRAILPVLEMLGEALSPARRIATR